MAHVTARRNGLHINPTPSGGRTAPARPGPRPRRRRLAAAALVLLGAGATVRAGYDVKVTETVDPGWTLTARVTFTKDHEPIGKGLFSYKNDTSTAVDKQVSFTAPDGTNDRSYKATATLAVAVNNGNVLPDKLVPDFAAFLAAHGFTRPSTFDSPLALGASGADAFVLINDLNAFLPFASASNFAPGSDFSTDANGMISALPGLTVFKDEALTTPDANDRVVINGVVSESVPEPSAFVLTSAGVLGLLALARLRRG